MKTTICTHIGESSADCTDALVNINRTPPPPYADLGADRAKRSSNWAGLGADGADFVATRADLGADGAAGFVDVTPA